MTVGLAVTLAPVVLFNPAAGVQVYPVAPLAVSPTDVPGHIVAEEGTTLTVGDGFTVTTTLTVSLHPPLEPITVYVDVVAGDAFGLGHAVQLNPAEGAHEYVDAPLAVSATESPLQTVGEDGTTLTVGGEFTVITTFTLSVQPPLVPATVYVVER